MCGCEKSTPGRSHPSKPPEISCNLQGIGSSTETPAIRNTDKAFVAAGLGALLAAALVWGVLHGGLPKLARVEAAAPVPAGGSGPAQPSASRLCFQGELLDLALTGQPCP